MARLLIDFLIRRGLVSDVKFLRRVPLEEQDPRFRRNAVIYLVKDRPAECEAFQISRVAVRVGQREDAFAFGQTAIYEIGPDEQFLRQFGHFVMAVLEHEDELVELRAIDFEFVAGDLMSHVAALAVVSHLEGLEGDLLRVHFVVAARPGEARI